MTSPSRSPAAQRGLAIGVIIAALALLALIAGALAVSSRDSGNFIPREEYRTMIISQAQMLRLKLARCALDDPAANNGDPNAADPTYPATPSGYHYLQDTICPGTGTSVFDGSDGVFFPQQIPGCNAWGYDNNKTDAIPYVQIELWCQDTAEGRAAISDVYDKLGAGEAELYTNNAGTPNDTLIVFLHK